MLIEACLLTISVGVMLQYLSTQYASVRYHFRLVLYFASLLFVAGCLVPLSIGLTLIGKRYNSNHTAAILFYFIISRLLGMTIVVEGEEHLQTNPAIFVGNHQSAVDVFYLGAVFPVRTSIMAKKSLKWVPILGQWMLMSGAVFIDRGNNKRAMASLEKAGKYIRSRSMGLWIFPEGTRTLFETPNMLPFKKGAFHLAVQAGVPIVPVVCENYWRLYHKGVFDSGVLKVKVLPPIPTTGLTSADVGELAIRTRDQMVQTLIDISVPVSDEVAAVDNAALKRISMASQPRHPPPVDATPASEPLPPAPAESHVTASGGGGAGQALEGSRERARKSSTSDSSNTDEEMVIVDRPT